MFHAFLLVRILLRVVLCFRPTSVVLGVILPIVVEHAKRRLGGYRGFMFPLPLSSCSLPIKLQLDTSGTRENSA